MPSFVKGDRVRIADPLPPYMGHFYGAGTVAKVVGSYADLYPLFDTMPNRHEVYCLEVPGHGRISWYPDSVLTPEDYD